MRYTCQCLNIEFDANVGDLHVEAAGRLQLSECTDTFFKKKLLYGQLGNIRDFVSPRREKLSARLERKKESDKGEEWMCYAIYPELARLRGSGTQDWMVLECFLCHTELFAVAVHPGISEEAPTDLVVCPEGALVAGSAEVVSREEGVSVWDLWLDAVVSCNPNSCHHAMDFSYRVKEMDDTKMALMGMREVVGSKAKLAPVDSDVVTEKKRILDLLERKLVIMATDIHKHPDDYSIRKRMSGELFARKPRAATQTVVDKPPPAPTGDVFDNHFDAYAADRLSSPDNSSEGEDAVDEEDDEEDELTASYMATSAPIDAPFMRRHRPEQGAEDVLPADYELFCNLTAEEKLYAIESANYFSRSACERTKEIFGSEGPPALRELRDLAKNSRRILDARVHAQQCGEDPDSVVVKEEGITVRHGPPGRVVKAGEGGGSEIDHSAEFARLTVQSEVQKESD